MPPVIRRTVILYSDEQGQEPFTEWYQSIKDHEVQSRIENRIKRLEKGLRGDHRSIADASGVCALRFHIGPEYRVYYAEDGLQVIVLLGAGGKKTQENDIHQAILRWQTYLNRKGHE